MTDGVRLIDHGIVIRNRLQSFFRVALGISVAMVVTMVDTMWALRDDSRVKNVHHPVIGTEFAVLGVVAVIACALAAASRTVITAEGIDDRWFLVRRRWTWPEVVALHAGAKSPAWPEMGLTVLSSTHRPRFLWNAHCASRQRRETVVIGLSHAVIPSGVLRAVGFTAEFGRRYDRSAATRVRATWWGPEVPAGAIGPDTRPGVRRLRLAGWLTLLCVALLARCALVLHR